MTDLAISLLRHGYGAVAHDRRGRGAAATYASRLLGRRAVVLGDPAGAVLFYDEAVVSRRGAVPPPLAWLLFGRGALHGLDGAEHRERKRVFLDVLSPEELGELVEDARARLLDRVGRQLDGGGELAVFDALVEAYGPAVLRWAGLRLGEEEARRASHRLAAVVDGFGFSGRAYARAWRERVRADRWAASVVADVRAGRREAAAGSPLARLATELDVDDRACGVELLNIVRPTVAVVWLGTFAAWSLAAAPHWAARLRGEGRAVERYAFAQEVRRTTPFVPVLAGRALVDTEHGGVSVRRGDHLLLDVYGIHHDPATWPRPGTFEPERFLGGSPSRPTGVVVDAYTLLAQGGGHPSGHRCPGESLALRLVEATVGVLADVELDVGSVTADLTRMPTLPADGLRVWVSRPRAATR